MKHAIIVHFAIPHLQLSLLCSEKEDAVYYLVNNGLDTEKTDTIRAWFNVQKEKGKDVQLFEYAQPTKTGKVVQDIFTWALNDPKLTTISYFNGAYHPEVLTRALAMGVEHPFLVFGRNEIIEAGMAYSDAAKKLFEGTQIKVYEAFKSKMFEHDKMPICPSFTVSAPFVFNLELFRRVMVIPQIAAAAQTAFIEAFNPEKDVDFELFFGYMYNVMLRVVPNNDNVLSFDLR